MSDLPRRARLFVSLVIAGGSTVLATHFPATLADPYLFIVLSIGSCLLSTVKLQLPMCGGAASLSASSTLDFMSLILLGPNATILVAVLSAWTQSRVKPVQRNAAYRSMFNMGALALAVYSAGWAFTAVGGDAGVVNIRLTTGLVAAALVYYFLNTGIVATAVGLSTCQPVWRVWQRNFLWTAPSYFVSAAAAAAAAAAWTFGWFWLLPVVAAPVYLTFRSYREHVERITAERQQRHEMLQLHARTQEALRAAGDSEQRYALAAAGANDGLWHWDLSDDAFYASDRWKLMIGLPAASEIQRIDDWFQHVHPEDVRSVRSAVERHLSGETSHFEHEYRMRHLDGTCRWILCRGVAVRDESDRPVRVAGSQTDVTERRRIQEQLSHAALHDTITGLANRAMFVNRIERALARARRSTAYSFAVLVIDLDRFQLINDSLGHRVGDLFLSALASRMLDQLRPGDGLARLGGDEFAVVLEGVREPRAAQDAADRLQAVLQQPFTVEGHEIYTSASVGITLSDARYRNAEDLLRDADIAMYRAKALGRSQCQTFDPSMHATAIRRLMLETELRRAVERDEFVLHYQPIVELESRQVCGFEALVRWRHSDGELTYPSEFIEIAEETGLIVPLSDWVLRRACMQIAEWQRTFNWPLHLAINISGRLFDRSTLVEEVRRAIADSDLVRGTLRLEITESFLLNSSDAVAKRLDELRSIPVELYLDDFGTGFSSLSYLQRYRLDALKIDRSFISRIGGINDDAPIVGSIVTLARKLGMGVIAEGVETAQQVKHLLALACPHAQGYLFSPPLTPGDASAFLSKQLARSISIPNVEARAAQPGAPPSASTAVI